MRIGIVSEYYYPSIGGVQEHVHHFAREARRLGHEATIITSAMPDLDPAWQDGPGVVRLGRSRPIYNNGGFGRVSQGLGLSAAMRDTLARERLDVVHVHCPLTPVLPYLAVHHARCPVVGTFHTNWQPGPVFRAARPILQRYLSRLDRAIAVSRACVDALEGGRLEADFEIIPNGVDLDEFGCGRKIPDFDDGRTNILWIGRLEPRNGFDLMLSVFTRARKELDARLLVVGDGPLMQRYREAVPPALRKDVVFAGRVIAARPDWYATADVCCMPIRIAGLPVTMLEGLASARPVLASDVEGFRGVVEHGRNGELLPPFDEDAWVRALVRVVREPLRAAAYAERARKTAQHFAWSTIARRILDVYRAAGVDG